MFELSKSPFKNMIANAKPEVKEWVDQMAAHFNPAKVHWCDGSREVSDSLFEQPV